MSCPGRLTLATTSPGPAIAAARSMAASVPSMASTATTARPLTQTVWPMSRPASPQALPQANSMSSRTARPGRSRGV